MPPSFASCLGLLETCGAGGDDRCCHSLLVSGGSYFRSYDLAGDGSSGGKGHPATVSDFRLDKYEVTVGRFRAFVNAGMGTQNSPPAQDTGAHAKILGSGWDPTWNASLEKDTMALKLAVQCTSMYQTWTDNPAANENRPMDCITWYEAMAFCIWDGGYLPTEAEWNYAAAGGGAQRAYPWSSPSGSLTPLDGFHASYQDGLDCVGDGMPGCALTDLVPVGTKPLGDGQWGQSDLAGNVWEWTLDWFDDETNQYADPCVDCANLTPGKGTHRMRRGGSFTMDPITLRTGNRSYIHPSERFNGVGVRCARSAS